MSEPVFLFDDSDPAMQQAYEAARQSFKFLWRELSWERRRIVPALDMHMVKLPFTDEPLSDGKLEFEHMWVGDVEFDGITLAGTLINSPNWLRSVKQGDSVNAPFSYLTDWMMVADGKAYGGHTVNLMRSRMSASERRAHDGAWGLDFSDPAIVRVELEGGEQPKRGALSKLFGSKSGASAVAGFFDHPMCVNMVPKIEEQLQQDRKPATSTDDRGWTMLHMEALAGNLGVVKLLVRYGAGIDAKTPDGRDAAALALGIGWSEIAAYLSNEARTEPRANFS